MSGLRVTVTGATGLLGPPLIAALQQRGASVTVLSRDPARARARLQVPGREPVEAAAWDLISEPAPAGALEGRDAVVHLAGENVAQRWSEDARQAILQTRVTGTRNLLAGLRAAGRSGAGQRPGTLVSASAIGYYGPHGEEPLDEDAPPGHDFLAQVCKAWESEALAAEELDMRVALVRTGVVLDRRGGALAKMLTPFRLGVGGPVAGGRQYMSWIHRDDVVGLIVAALEDVRYSGPINATAPEPASNRDFSHALGRALHRPALLPVPGVAMQLLFGDMSQIVTTGARVVPAKALVLGYRFSQPELDAALRSAVGHD